MNPEPVSLKEAKLSFKCCSITKLSQGLQSPTLTFSWRKYSNGKCSLGGGRKKTLEQKAGTYLDQVYYGDFLKSGERQFLQNKLSAHLHKFKEYNLY